MSKMPFTGDPVAWETYYCGRVLSHSGVVSEYVQRGHVLWAIVKKPNGKTTMVQASRIELSSRNHNVVEMQKTGGTR